MTQASNLSTATTDTNTYNDAYVRGLDLADPLGVDALLFAERRARRRRCSRSSTRRPVRSRRTVRRATCRSAGGNAAYLRPESDDRHGRVSRRARSTATATRATRSCTSSRAAAATSQNLGLAATAVRPSRDRRSAALLDEAGQNGTDLNGDGDAVDTVLAARLLSGGPLDERRPRGRHAHRRRVRASRFITPEAAQGDASLNGDADADDRVAQLYDVATRHLRQRRRGGRGRRARRRPAGTVCGPRQLLAIRSPEADAGRRRPERRRRRARRRAGRLRRRDRHDVRDRPGGHAVPARGVRSAHAVPRERRRGALPHLRDRPGRGPRRQRHDRRARAAELRRLHRRHDRDRHGRSGRQERPDRRSVDQSQVFTTTAGRCATDARACRARRRRTARTARFCNAAHRTAARSPRPRPAVADGDCPSASACVAERVTVGPPVERPRRRRRARRARQLLDDAEPARRRTPTATAIGDACDALAARTAIACAAGSRRRAAAVPRGTAQVDAPRQGQDARQGRLAGVEVERRAPRRRPPTSATRSRATATRSASTPTPTRRRRC